jgi:nondiscriminating glutamyl-tRNA synthetase
MNNRTVRVRIAPSPTGFLHVGTARMAIANYLFARHVGGKFLVRIEDTDVERSRTSLIEPILSALKWLGLSWDEEIVYQSQRTGVYKRHARQILESGYGYRCFCTPEELEEARQKARAEKRSLHYDRRCLHLSEVEVKKRLAAGRKFAIRLKIPDGETIFQDMVSGTLKRRNEEIEDLIVARSDGTATYNLAVVIDDHDMGITHVIRGNDHVTNTFKQVHIYRALGWEPPSFGHLPMILRPDKKKVSKRLGDKDVNQYSTEGIIPEAMFNYLCLLGWSPKTDREIYTADELVNIFNPDNFNSSNAIFDEEKLVAFNREHIVLKTDYELADLVAPLLVEAGLSSKYWLETRWDYLRAVVGVLKERVRRLSDFVALGGYFFTFDYKYDPAAAKKQFTPEGADLLGELANRFEALPEFSLENTEQTLNAFAEERGIKRAQLIHPTRLAVTGVPAGPGLYDILVTLTKPVVVERMRKASEYIRSLKTVN